MTSNPPLWRGPLAPLAAALVAAVLGGCSLFLDDVEPPDVELRGVAIERLSLAEQVFRLNFRLQNPNERRLRVRAARIRLELEGIPVGEGVMSEALRLPPLGEAGMNMRFTTDLVAKGGQLWRWFSSADPDLGYRVSGYIDVGGAGLIRLNIDESGRVSVPHLATF